MLSSSAVVASRKTLVPRWVVLVVMAIAIVALGGIVLTWLSTATVPVTGTTQTVSITGAIQSVNAINHSITVSSNGQLYTINGLTDADVAQLQINVGKTYTIQATQNADGSYTIVKGSQPVAWQPTATQRTTTWVPGNIQFIGPVKSVNASTIVVQMPDGPLTMSITPQTDRSLFSGNLPAAGQLVKVETSASNGNFIVMKLGPFNAIDAANQNIVQYQGVTTSPVGADNILHFAVGNKIWSFTINSTTDLSKFGNNAQSIQANQPLKVEVQFNGSNGSVLKIANGP
jgi:hypothetical protein